MRDRLDHLRVVLSDRYAIQRELGEGGMAHVYLADDLRHSRKVALKVIRPELAEAVGSDRFLREIRITAGLVHPHIRPLLDSGHIEHTLFYAMPFAEGETLREWLDREGQLPVEDAFRLTREIADGLDYAHESGVVHRDIKPANIMIEAGHAVISDFGVALAIESHGQERITGSGVTVGTAEYMSPEQCGAEGQLDGRSDIYSLGCVLYEMLAGQPPFTGRTALAVVARHLREPAPSIRVVRPDVPEPVDELIRRAMAKAPADRFKTAGQMRDALSHAQVVGPAARVRSWTAVAAVATAIAVLLVLFLTRGGTPPIDVDPSLYVVLPFVHRDGSAPGLITGDRCETLVYQSLDRWGVQVVDLIRVNDALARRRGVISGLEDALAISRSLGAGRLIWGQLWDAGDSTVVRGVLYDVAEPERPVQEYATRIPPDLQDFGARFDEMVDGLLFGQTTSRAAATRMGGTTSFDAFLKFDEGHRFLEEWDLDGASEGFGSAVDIDPEYTQASLWRALVGLFSGEPASSWRAHASRALAAPSGLLGTDSLLAASLNELAGERWVQACEGFSELVALDRASFTAWLGLGECLARDRVVVENSAIPSGWSFRSSWHAAGEAYRAALQLVPSYNLVLQDTSIARLESVLPTVTTRMRGGHALLPDTVLFAAFVELEDDTLGHVPYLLPEIIAGRRANMPATTTSAVDRNRQILMEITGNWATAFPDDPGALEALARAQEPLGLLEATGDFTTSALDAVRRARVRADSLSALRLTMAEVRMLTKLGQFAEAARLSDSILLGNPTPSPREATDLAGLALLIGRVHRAAELLEVAAVDYEPYDTEGTVPTPLPLIETANRLLAYASAGAPMDSLIGLRTRAKRQAESLVPGNARDRVMRAALSWPLTVAYAEIRPEVDDPEGRVGNYLNRWYKFVESGDLAPLREDMALGVEQRSVSAPASMPLSFAYGEARVYLALGDTATAIEVLDHPLQSLRLQDQGLTQVVHHAGGLVRAMALRAELASAAGDTPVQQLWANRVVTLWAGGDDSVQAVVERMRSLLN